MSTLTFDTLKYAERLRDVLSEALDSTLATQADMAKIDSKLERMEAKFDKVTWMIGILIALALANFAKQYF